MKYILLTLFFATALLAPALAQTKKPAMIWANTFYGTNNSGIGLGWRSHAVGIGASIFGFAGDSATSLPPRPGGRGYTIDGYIFIETSSWLAIHGSIGYGGWIGAYAGQEKLVESYDETGGLTAGGGLTFSLLSRFVIGAGYAGMFDTGQDEGDPTYDPIHRLVVQLGVRY